VVVVVVVVVVVLVVVIVDFIFDKNLPEVVMYVIFCF
jgi:hypothetical protein